MEKTDFIPAVRFLAFSDAHVNEADDEACRRVSGVIKAAYELASKDEHYKKLDAVFSVGDQANNGQKSQFEAFIAAVNKEKKDETLFRCVLAKYHDCVRGGGRETLDLYKELTGLDTDWHVMINGFHFIGISVSPDVSVHYSDEQKEWLKNELDSASAESGGRPVFVFQHEHIRDTVYGSTLFDGWGELYLADVISAYPNVVDVSGHSHYPAADPRALWQGGFTAVNDGGLAYYEFTFLGERKVHPENAPDMADFLIIEASADGAVKIKVCNLTENAVRREYFIENPACRPYTTEKRTEKAAAPVFPADCVPEIQGTEEAFSVRMRPASVSEDDAVFYYTLTVFGANGDPLIVRNKLSDYYHAPVPGDVIFAEKLPAGRYTAELKATDVWGKEGRIRFTLNVKEAVPLPFA